MGGGGGHLFVVGRCVPNFLPVSVGWSTDTFLPSVGAAEFFAGFGGAAGGRLFAVGRCGRIFCRFRWCGRRTFFSAIHVEGDGSAVFPPRPAVFLLTFVARCFLVGRWRMAKCGRRMPIQR